MSTSQTIFGGQSQEWSGVRRILADIVGQDKVCSDIVRGGRQWVPAGVWRSLPTFNNVRLDKYPKANRATAHASSYVTRAMKRKVFKLFN